MPMGKLAKMASSRFAMGDLKARLWDISWIARKRFWLAVAPNTYATAQNFRDQKGVFRSRCASVTWRATTPRTTYFVKGSGPQSLVTCCSKLSQSMVQKKNTLNSMTNLWMRLNNRQPSCPMWLLCVGPEEVALLRLNRLLPLR